VNEIHCLNEVGKGHRTKKKYASQKIDDLQMNGFDNFVNNIITPNSVGAGIGTVMLTFFTSHLAPKLPSKAYKLLDNTLIRIVATAYLLNQQIRQPSTAVIIAVMIVIFFELVVSFFTPEAPSLSELVKSTAGVDSKQKQEEKKSQGCNCYCGHTIHVQEDPLVNKRRKIQQIERRPDRFRGLTSIGRWSSNLSSSQFPIEPSVDTKISNQMDS
jgi:hypothetical protein